MGVVVSVGQYPGSVLQTGGKCTRMSKIQRKDTTCHRLEVPACCASQIPTVFIFRGQPPETDLRSRRS